jgi:CheY-like chemotaxis protein/HPt (histidine-containing phosphotransfer) domain-containing protein
MRKEGEGINLIVKIRDSGIGIEEKNIEKLFTSFNQVDTKRNRQEGGIGLGLAISKAILEKMQGFINIKSKPGEGTQVQFVLPQQVVDARPMIKLEKPQEIHLLYYIKMAKFQKNTVRDEYQNCIRHMQEQFGIEAFACRNLSDLKHRVEREEYTHLFMGWDEYMEDKEYFDSIQDKICIILILDGRAEMPVGAHIRRIHKPFYALSVAAILNDETVGMEVDATELYTRQFLAPTASVLVVDDNIMNLKVVEGLLAAYKIKVFTAGSGREALDKLSSMSYDFVFMDHMMPEMDGVECFHRIRKRPGKYFQNVPVIALTANAVAGAREMFLAEGFQDFVAKPVEISALERVLRKYIPEEKIQKISKRPEPAEGKETDETAKSPAKEGQEASSVQEAPDKEQDHASSLEEQLEKADIHIEAALPLYGGEMDFYKEMLTVFAESGKEKMLQVEEAYSSADWKQYTILVHSVKSNAGSIGAETLADMARNLEMAGKEDRISYIREQHAAMMKQYEKTLDAIERGMR